MYLKKLKFQSKVIKFPNDFICNYYLKIIIKNKQARIVSPIEKWTFLNSTSLCRIFNISDHAPRWNMSRKNLKDGSKRMEKYLFQVGCMSYPNLKQNMAFKEKDERCLS